MLLITLAFILSVQVIWQLLFSSCIAWGMRNNVCLYVQGQHNTALSTCEYTPVEISTHFITAL